MCLTLNQHCNMVTCHPQMIKKTLDRSKAALSSTQGLISSHYPTTLVFTIASLTTWPHVLSFLTLLVIKWENRGNSKYLLNKTLKDRNSLYSFGSSWPWSDCKSLKLFQVLQLKTSGVMKLLHSPYIPPPSSQLSRAHTLRISHQL